MIPLTLRLAEPFDGAAAVALRLTGEAEPSGPSVGRMRAQADGTIKVESAAGRFRLAANRAVRPTELEGDVVALYPAATTLVRLLRAGANANTILLTEECDQLCQMCSQPPVNRRYDHWQVYAQAVELAPRDAVIGISGGEPTLLKEALFAWLEVVTQRRPDVTFHILTNAQHFTVDDSASLVRLRERVLWGVPLYARNDDLHDEIVGKAGAHQRLLENLNLLAAAGAAVELRTVVMQTNFAQMPALADFVTTHLGWVTTWAIMQLERYGYGRRNWSRLFVDTSFDFTPLAASLRIAETAQLPVSLYNFPRCTVPQEFRALAAASISDWKQRYLPICNGCAEKEHCGGFFEWYRSDEGFKKVAPL